MPDIQDANQSEPETTRPRLVPVWQLIMVAALIAGLAWFNVRFTFAFVESYLRSSPGLRLLGSYLPHALVLIVCVGGMILWMGKLRLRDLGLKPSNLPIAIGLSIAFWAIIALLAQFNALSIYGQWEWNSRLQSIGGLGLIADLLVTQVLGNALLEELVFRGYFFQQFHYRLRDWLASRIFAAQFASITFAVILSLLLFVAVHIPIRLHNGVYGQELIQNLVRVAIWGSVFSSLFIITRNLWLVIGIHALTNRPCLWAEPATSLRAEQLYLCLGIGLAFVVYRQFLNGAERRKP